MYSCHVDLPHDLYIFSTADDTGCDPADATLSWLQHIAPEEAP